jgi:hypothetical protein
LRGAGPRVRKTTEMDTNGRGRSPARRALVLAGLVLLCVVAAAAALPRGWPFSGRASEDAVVVPDVPAFAAYLLIAIAMMSIVLIALSSLSPLSPQLQKTRRSPVWVQIAIVVLAMVVASQISDVTRFVPSGAGTQSSRDGGGSAAREPPPRPRSRALGVAVAAFFAVVLGAMIAVVALLWGPRRGTVSARRRDDPLEAAVESAAVDLAAIPDARAAVIACYARMEGALAEMGVPRQPADTPVELLGRALRARSAPEESVVVLTDLFEVARFSAHDIDEDMRASALDALHAILGFRSLVAAGVETE